MSFISEIKPYPWLLESGLVDPNWRWAWRDLPLLVPLWEGGGDPFNLAGRRQSLAKDASASWGGSRIGTALNHARGTQAFSQASDWGIKTADGSGTGDFTVMFWFLPDLTNDGPVRSFLSCVEGVTFRSWQFRSTFSDIEFFIEDDTAGSDVAEGVSFITDGEWTVAFGRRKGTELSIRVGNQVATKTLTATINVYKSSGQTLSCGAESISTGEVFGWNRALEEAEMAALARDPAGLVRMVDEVALFPAAAVTPAEFYRMHRMAA